MKYSAIALNDKFNGGRQSASLHFSEQNLVCSFNEEELLIPASQVELSLGGASQRLIYLRHSKLGATTLYTTELQFLQDSALAGNLSVQNVLAAKNKFRTRNLLSIAAIMLFIGAVILGFVLNQNKLVKLLADQVPIQSEQELGEKIFGSVVEESQLIKDSILIAQITHIAQPIVEQVEDSNFYFQFDIIDDPTMNAFALPGGRIVINSGLINMAESWEEIQGVLAHEISHVTKRHHVRGIISKLGVMFLLSAFIGDGSAIMDAVYQYGSQLESLMYSRNFEQEADDSGWEYLVGANINPSGMIQFFEKLDEKSSEEDQEKENEHDEDDRETDATVEELTSFLSSHPATTKRIEILNKKLLKLKTTEFIKSEIDLEQFKTRLNQKI